MKNIKVYKIVLEGIDKTGKDLLVNYINKLTNYKYVVSARGIISVMSYNEIYDRKQIGYDLRKENNTLNVLLTVDKEDWEIRCKSTNEPSIDYEINSQAFLNNFEKIKTHKVMYNTSNLTPYQIAQEIKKEIEKINKE